MADKEKLTAKEERFCQKMMELNSQSAAYRQAYDVKRMTEQSIHVEAARIMKRERVKNRIAALRAAYADKIGVTVERVLLEKSRIAFLDIRNLYRADGTVKPLHELDDDTAAAISSFEVEHKLTEEGTKKKKKLGVTKTAKVKAYDKSHALTDLMRHLGMFEKDNVQKADAFSQMLVSMGAIDGPQD